MKLEINLDDREEISAGHSLLAMLLDATPVCGTVGTFQTLNAEVSAAAPAPLPPVAPSTAAVAVSPTAPVAAPVSLMVPPVPQPPAPMPAAVAPVPMAPAAPSSPASDVKLDSKGLPWDERIHASTKTTVADGSWKKKKGINDPALIARVEAELRARVAADAHLPAGVDTNGLHSGGAFPGMPEAPTQDPAVAFGGAAAPVPFAPPVAPSLPAMPVAPSASADPTTFEQLMTLVSPLVVATKLPPTATNQAATANGLANIVALQTAPQFVPLVWATLKQMYPAAFV